MSDTDASEHPSPERSTPDAEDRRKTARSNGPPKRRIREGRIRKGGMNLAPKTPRPNVHPKPQKPSASSSDGSSADDGSDE